MTVTTKKKTNKKPAGKQASKELGSATAASILGQAAPPSRRRPGNGTVKIKPEWVKYYNTLLELRERGPAAVVERPLDVARDSGDAAHPSAFV